MAASITGTFTIIDRASGPMRKMEAQAKKTMLAIEGVGQAHDKASGGSAAQKHEQQARAMRNVERAAKAAGGGVDDMGRKMRDSDRHGRGLVNTLTRIGGALTGLRMIMRAGMFAGLGTAVTALAQGIGVLAGGFVALIPAVAQAAGVLAALPASIGAAVQGVGTLMVALGGVGGAISAGIKQQQQAGAAAQDMGQKQRSAANSIRQAERALFVAQRSSRDAQKELTAARREARRELIDLRLAAVGAVLGEQRAALSLREAKQSLSRASMDPGTSSLDMQGAQLAVREARLGVRQAKVERQRAGEDMRRGVKKGVEGSDKVVAARRNLSDAIYGQTEATRNLAEAQKSANESLKQGSASASAFQTAMKELSPEAQSFVRQIIGMRPAMKELKAAAGKELFPALSRGLTRVTKLFPLLRSNMQSTGGVIGKHTEGLATDLTSGSRMGDMDQLMKHQTGLLDRMGRGFRNIISALIDLSVAAQPFTDWLADTVLGWTKLWKESARAGRETGSIAAKLARTKDVLQRFGRILSNLWGVFKGLGRAAAPLGDRLWKGAEKATEGWEKYLNSVEGSSEARTWFNKLYDPLHELGQLSADLAKVWAKITVDPAFTRTIQTLREAVPHLEKLLLNLSGLGPSAASVLSEIVRLLSNLPFSPLQLLLEALAGILKVVNTLLEKFPALSNVLAAALTGMVMLKAISMAGKLLRHWRELAVTWGGMRPPPMPAPPMSPGTRGAPGGGAGGAPVLVPGGGGRRGGGLLRGGAARRATGSGSFLGGGVVPGSRAGGAGKVAMGGLKAAGRFAGPLAGMMAMFDFMSTEGGVGKKSWGALSGASMGIIPGPSKGGEREAETDQTWAKMMRTGKVDSLLGEKGAGWNRFKTGPKRADLLRKFEGREIAGGRNPKSLRGVEASITGGAAGGGVGLRQIRDELASGKHTAEERRMIGLLNEEIKARKEILHMGRIQKGAAVANDLSKAFAIFKDKRGPAFAMKRTVNDTVGEIKRLGRNGGRAVGQNMLAWARQQEKHDPKLKGFYSSMRRHVIRQFRSMGRNISIVNGQILTGSEKEWSGIKRAMTTKAEKAAQEVNESFTAIQNKAVGSLKAMGFSDKDAKGLVGGMEAGGKRGKAATRVAEHGSATPYSPQYLETATGNKRGNAQGGRIPGAGLRDTVPVAPGQLAAPGELIVNRHTERDIDRKLAPYGTSLGGEVGGETRRHSQPVDGRPMHRRRARFAKGGIVPVPGSAGEEAHSSILDEIALTKNRWGLTLTDAFDRDRSAGHSSAGHNVTGTSADFAGPDASMDKAVKYWVSKGYQVGYDGRFGSQRWSGHGPRSVAGGNAHLHVDFGGTTGKVRAGAPGAAGAGDAGGEIQKIDPLKAPRSKLAGAPGALSGRAGEIYAKGMTKAINKKLEARGPQGGGGPSGGSGRAPRGRVRRWLARALRATGHYSEANLNALYGRVMQESGGDPRAVNNWDSNAAKGTPSKGLIQTIGPTFDAHKMPGHGNIFNPVDNAIAAIRYMFSRYGHIVGPSGSGYATGGRLPNGDMVVNRHTEGRISDYMGIMPGLAAGGRIPNVSGIPIVPGMGDLGIGGEPKVEKAKAGGKGRSSGGSGAYDKMVARANAIDAKRYPYKWGGGHGGFRGPYDCSGAVSAVLHSGGLLDAPMASGGLMNWGKPGSGKVTVFSNPGHVYMRLGNRYFGTTKANPGGGAGWFSGSARSGFTQRTAPSVNATGGRVADWGGWNAKGGRYRVDRPTVFGAGESGTEDVTITPKGKSKRPAIHLNIERIDYRREGDVEKAIKRELANVVEDLDLVGDDD